MANSPYSVFCHASVNVALLLTVSAHPTTLLDLICCLCISASSYIICYSFFLSIRLGFTLIGRFLAMAFPPRFLAFIKSALVIFLRGGARAANFFCFGLYLLYGIVASYFGFYCASSIRGSYYYGTAHKSYTDFVTLYPFDYF